MKKNNLKVIVIDIFFIKNVSITGQVLAIDSGQNLSWQTPNIICKE